MNKIDMEIEVIITSKYCEIVESMLSKNENLSIVKIAIYAFLYKKSLFTYRNVFRSNTKYDLVLKSISLLNGMFDEFCDDLVYILEAIDLLAQNKIIEVIGSEVFLVKRRITSMVRDEFLENAIVASKSLSDRQLLKEVIGCV